jgi:hypothetical protein
VNPVAVLTQKRPRVFPQDFASTTPRHMLATLLLLAGVGSAKGSEAHSKVWAD